METKGFDMVDEVCNHHPSLDVVLAGLKHKVAHLTTLHVKNDLQAIRRSPSTIQHLLTRSQTGKYDVSKRCNNETSTSKRLGM